MNMWKRIRVDQLLVFCWVNLESLLRENSSVVIVEKYLRHMQDCGKIMRWGREIRIVLRELAKYLFDKRLHVK